VTLDEIVRELQSAHDEGTIDFAADALSALDLSGDETRNLLRHRWLAVRRAAVLALGHAKTKRPDAAALVSEKLGDQNGLLRRDATRALGLIGDRAAIPQLEAALRDPKAFVRATAAEALAALGGRAALEPLGTRCHEERDRAARRAVIEAVGKLGKDPGLARSALETLLGHVGREDDPILRARLVTLALETARGRGKEDLVPALRSVPSSGRELLANALAERARELDPALASLVIELRAEPPDPAALAEFGSDLTARVRRAPLAHTYGREREIELARTRLAVEGTDGGGAGATSRPRSVVLVGPSGAGKTAIVEELARRYALEPRVVPTLVLEVTTGDVMAGTKFLGEWQTRLKKLLEATRSPRRVVWYVPDVNQLLEAGRSSSADQNFASMIAPYLERGEVAIVGESTPEAFRRGLERDPPFRKLFQVVPVESMNAKDALEVVRGVAAEIVQDVRERRGIELAIEEESLTLALDHGESYFPGLARPGNGLKLLRETTGAALEARPAPTSITVTPQLVTRTLATLTGVPEVLINDALPLDLAGVKRFFSEHVLGQPEAVSVVTDLITLVKAGLADPNKPLGVFFFVGPTGVGKTEMAKALAEFIYGSPERLVRLDMADYKDPQAFRRLTGDPNALSPEARTGALTAPVHERPFSVVLLDEIEKAHPNVFDLLLPLMDDGRLSDDHGRVTDFRRTIVIMTSNIASDLREDVRFGFSYGKPDTREKVERIMAEHFRPEWLNRLDKTVIFSPLTLEVMRKIARREVGRVLARQGILRRKVVIDVDDSVVGLLLREGFSERFGARPLKRRVERLVLQPLARTLVALEQGSSPTIVRLRARGEHVHADRIGGPALAAEEEEDDRPLPRIRDPRDATRRVSGDELKKRADELANRIEALTRHLDGLGLRARKDALLHSSQDVTFWDEPVRARNVLAEVAALEKALDAPSRLRKRLVDYEDSLDRATKPGMRDPRPLVRAAEIWDELARDVELSDYAARCAEPRDRGDAFVLIRRVGEPRAEADLVARLAEMYRRWATRKGLAAVPVLESVGPDGIVRECALRVEGVCAFGLLRGEDGLHQWIDRRGTQRTDTRSREVDFVRVDVLPPAPFELRPDEIKVEARPVKRQGGKLMKRHRVFLVLTHDETMVAVEGASDRKPSDVIPEATAVLAARVAFAREAADASGEAQASLSPDDEGITGTLAEGVVRRYVLSTQPIARDLASGLKAPLERVLEGDLDEFIAHRLSPAPG
jgi:ATP-dependent Clp protease ATP-binding subunit ClpA/protein subunit release factor B